MSQMAKWHQVIVLRRDHNRKRAKDSVVDTLLGNCSESTLPLAFETLLRLKYFLYIVDRHISLMLTYLTHPGNQVKYVSCEGLFLHPPRRASLLSAALSVCVLDSSVPYIHHVEMSVVHKA